MLSAVYLRPPRPLVTTDPLTIPPVPIARWRMPPPFVVGKNSGLGQFEPSEQALARLIPFSREFVGTANFGARKVRKLENSAVFMAPDKGSFRKMVSGTLASAGFRNAAPPCAPFQ